jgi:hypothetical protein
MKTAAEFLIDAAATFKEKNGTYGDNYLNVGKAMVAFFPNGIEVKTADDWNRLHIFLLQIVKLTRYCNNWIAVDEKHAFARSDSMHDNTVYSAMLESIDAMIAEAMKLAPVTQLEDDQDYRNRILSTISATQKERDAVIVANAYELDELGATWGLRRIGAM